LRRGFTAPPAPLPVPASPPASASASSSASTDESDSQLTTCLRFIFVQPKFSPVQLAFRKRCRAPHLTLARACKQHNSQENYTI
jgi:hypothetical protein